jgi:hypothetical protein
MDDATHQDVFGWVLRQVARSGLLRGKTIGIDATTLQANAAMKSIVRRDTEESYTEYLKRLAEAAGLEATDEAALRRMDRRRKKKGSNQEWVNPHDPEAEITRLKDGRTAHAYGTGALRRLYVRGKQNVQKRLLLQAAACNLALLLRRLIGAGTPRAFQDVVIGLFFHLMRLISTLNEVAVLGTLHVAPGTSFADDLFDAKDQKSWI